MTVHCSPRLRPGRPCNLGARAAELNRCGAGSRGPAGLDPAHRLPGAARRHRLRRVPGRGRRGLRRRSVLGAVAHPLRLGGPSRSSSGSCCSCCCWCSSWCPASPPGPSPASASARRSSRCRSRCCARGRSSSGSWPASFAYLALLVLGHRPVPRRRLPDRRRDHGVGAQERRGRAVRRPVRVGHHRLLLGAVQAGADRHRRVLRRRAPAARRHPAGVAAAGVIDSTRGNDAANPPAELLALNLLFFAADVLADEDANLGGGASPFELIVDILLEDRYGDGFSGFDGGGGFFGGGPVPRGPGRRRGRRRVRRRRRLRRRPAAADHRLRPQRQPDLRHRRRPLPVLGRCRPSPSTSLAVGGGVLAIRRRTPAVIER